jgi:Zn-dependent protease with chaperone function
MDFFEQQDKARKKTKLLIFYFAVAVTLIIVMMYFVVLIGYLYAGAQQHRYHYGETSEQFALWNPNVLFGAAIVTLAIITIGCAYKINQLAEGGSALAESLGGRLVNPNSTDLDERKLLNVVEEMAIASGVPVPKVYVLDDEKGINAFAAGHTTSDAAVAVTYGCIKLLSREELQGVIGHEFSHILNGDMRLNIRLIGILFGILCIATIGRILLRTRGNRNPLPLFGVLLLIIGSVGVLFGRLIQAAVSRQREFLADASSVQFTRNPGGLSGALQKIGGYGFSSWLLSEHAPDAGHLFFGNGNPRPIFRAMSTHPPLEDRIHAIDSTWDGKFARVSMEKIQADDAKRPREPKPIFFDGKMIVLGGAITGSGGAEKPPVIKPRTVLPNLGNPTPLHLQYAEQLRNSLPENIKAAAREPLDSAALILALILSADENERAGQIAEIAKRFSPDVSEKTAALFPDVSSTAKHARLPMVNLVIGALKQMSTDDFQKFSQTLQWLINCDGKVELFEFVLQKIVLRHLDSQFNAARKNIIQFYTLKPLVPDCAVVLSALANVSSNDTVEISKAFETGAPYLRAPDDSDLQLLPREQCGVDQIDAALNRLAQAVPTIKKNLIEACIHVVGADGVIVESEAELLRAISDTLDCPMPPFMPTE